MIQEIYGDVLFIINFSMDFLSLFLTGKLCHVKMKAWRIISGATLGALYSVVELLFPFPKAVIFIFTVLCMTFMCMLAFGIPGKKRFFSFCLLFVGINMLMGGIMTAAFTLLGPYESYLRFEGTIHTVYGDIPVYLFALFAAISAFLTWAIGRLFKRKRSVSTCDIKIIFGETATVKTAFTDSGNLLLEPLSGAPVVMIKEKAADFLPSDLLTAMKDGNFESTGNLPYRLRIVPSRTVTGEGILLACFPTDFQVRVGDKWESREALIAIDKTDGDYGGLDVLIPENLVLQI